MFVILEKASHYIAIVEMPEILLIFTSIIENKVVKL